MSDLGFGLWLTAGGMGVVFGILALLWAMLAIIGRIDVATAESEAEAEPTAAAAPAESAPALALTADELAAVTAVVLAHQAARRRQAAPEMRSVVPGSQIWASRWLAAGRTRQTRGWQGRR